MPKPGNQSSAPVRRQTPRKKEEAQLFYQRARDCLKKNSAPRVHRSTNLSRSKSHLETGYAKQIPPLCQNLSCLAKEAEEAQGTEPVQDGLWYRPPQPGKRGRPGRPGQPGLSADNYNDLSLLAQYGVRELLYFLSGELEELLEKKHFQDMLDLLVRPASAAALIKFCHHSFPIFTM